MVPDSTKQSNALEGALHHWDAPYSYIHIHAGTDIGEVVDWITDKFLVHNKGDLAVLHNRNKMVNAFTNTELDDQNDSVFLICLKNEDFLESPDDSAFLQSLRFCGARVNGVYRSLALVDAAPRVRRLHLIAVDCTDAGEWLTGF